MKVKRIVHSILCLVLCCCILLHSMPVKADATAAGAAAVITGAAGVSVAAPLVIGASLVALGIMAKNTNPLVFENMVNDAVASLSAAGTWVKDGTVELLQTIDEAGQKAYYVAGDMLEAMRSYVFDSGTVVDESAYDVSNNASLITSSIAPVYFFKACYHQTSSKVIAADWYVSSRAFSGFGESSGYNSEFGVHWISVNSTSYSYIPSGYRYVGDSRPFDLAKSIILSGIDSYFTTNSDLTLGYLPSSDVTLTDDVIVTISPYDVKTIRTKYGGSGNNGNGKNWWVGVGLAASVASLATKTQQQVIEDPQVEEVPDLNTNVEFRIEYETEVETNPDTGEESKKGIIVLNPVEVPGAGGSGSDATIPTTEEIPELLKGLWADIKTSFSDLPNKFSNWFDAIIEWLRKIWESIQTLVSSLLEGLRQLLIELFAPSETFISSKVNSLTTKYPYMDTFLGLGADLKSFFLGLGTKPPVIYINLGAATGSYDLGGVQPFIDLSWYAAYKPTMDAVLGAFLWLWLAWRVFLTLPGLINGASGAAGSVIRYQERSPKSSDGGANK